MMKNVLAALLVVGGFIGSCAQDIQQKNVPSVVLNAFMTTYPQATDVEWELRGGTYNVEFEIGEIDHEAWFDGSGKLLKHKEEVPHLSLPSAIADLIKHDFSSYKLDGVDKMEENGKTFYLIELDGTPNDRILHVSPDGKILENRIDY
jgi:hypothetical protein